MIFLFNASNFSLQGVRVNFFLLKTGVDCMVRFLSHVTFNLSRYSTWPANSTHTSEI